MVISDYYKSLETKQKTQFIKDVIDLCDISYPSFMKKIRDEKWTKLEKEAIERFINSQQNGRRED